jgi:DNA mismatch endonuclease (patch repair protein)
LLSAAFTDRLDETAIAVSALNDPRHDPRSKTAQPRSSPDPSTLQRPSASSDHIRRRMEQQRRRDTGPELALRKAVWRLGLRYRVDISPIPGRRRADLVFTRAKVAVYVDGCFWHMCPAHSSIPKANRDWWIAKLNANFARDRAADACLREAGWTVVRIWEHEDAEFARLRIAESVSGRPSQGDV